ncbi:hypothetical protein [Emticicia agri]|uniref:C1q domain-containing protein n=1 Tax=Emticicia agri TaxID=2492393 RepID=A0A4Q5M3V6_9BACT|nr:hypothetical protein [Emticicia agri]RYU97004.1 hypothetical protein EWM59_03590 [Emticicia agri]
MKRTFFTLILIIGFFAQSFAQSITLEPDGSQLPRFATNPACTVADRGKQVYNTVQNKIYYCNGTSWINSETGTPFSPTPAFRATNGSGFSLTNTFQAVPFTFLTYDLAGNFKLNYSQDLPNTFIAHENGVYEFKLKARISLNSFTPAPLTKITFVVFSGDEEGAGETYYFTTPVTTQSNGEDISLGISLKLVTGRIVKFSVKYDGGGSGTLYLNSVVADGHLVAKY